ncbi:MAG: [LysW]-aminoadipate/[LysW]-glutamate kinase [Thermoprotei archaeon]|nr:[LysW]-aminoadipate/[LysW]-glutamate kinase [Thermoprotei archaeon]
MIVVKVGGRVLKANIRAVAEDIVSLWRKGYEVVLVHGGGDVVTEYSTRMGVNPVFILSPEGVRSRYTTLEELEVYIMVMAGKINKSIVSALESFGGRAVGISGVDGPTLIAERKKKIVIVDERGRRRVIEGGYTGRIVNVDINLLKLLTENKYIPVIAPIALGEDGTPLNVDGDQAALKIAEALKVDTAIILTDVGGLIVEGEIVREVGIGELDTLIHKVGAGMNRKLLQAREAIIRGVKAVAISSGLGPQPVTRAIENAGTIIRL